MRFYFSAPDKLAKWIKKEAKSQGLSPSQYLLIAMQTMMLGDQKNDKQ